MITLFRGKLRSLAVFTLLPGIAAAAGAPGDPDVAFHGNGIVLTALSGRSVTGQSVALQPDGRMVVAGYASPPESLDADGFVVIRYLPDGSEDSSFNSGGRLIAAPGAGAGARSVRVQADGRIVVAGSVFSPTAADFAIARFNAEGSPDLTFNSTGSVITAVSPNADYATALAIQPDGKLVVAGTKSDSNGTNDDFVVVRYLPNGTLDTGFNLTGIRTLSLGSGTDSARGLAIQPDGKIVVAGSTQTAVGNDVAVIRLTPSGIPDSTFSGDGIAVIATAADDAGESLALQSDGKIVIAGYAFGPLDADFAVLRLLPGGELDPAFAGSGRMVTPVGSGNDLGQSVAIQANGKIIVAGYSRVAGNDDFSFVRCLSDGTLDTSFNGSGKKIVAVSDGFDFAKEVAVQTDGNIVAAGFSDKDFNSRIAVVRLIGDAQSASDLWRLQYFGSTAAAGDAADLSDPDHDDAVNIVEFVRGTDPTRFVPSPERLIRNGAGFEYYYARRKGIFNEIEIKMEWANSVDGPWSAVVPVSNAALDDNDIQSMKAVLPPDSAPRRFIRLRIKRF